MWERVCVSESELVFAVGYLTHEKLSGLENYFRTANVWGMCYLILIYSMIIKTNKYARLILSFPKGRKEERKYGGSMEGCKEI